MTTDIYVYIITALLPLTAAMLIFQVNPYHALVVRGILGAVAALVYTVLGAADVALTEALVGTLLAITLYAVAVRSSLVFRVGMVSVENALPADVQSIQDQLKRIFSQHYMQIEWVAYSNPEDLQKALIDKDVHATCTLSNPSAMSLKSPSEPYGTQTISYTMTTRLRRLYDILHAEGFSSIAHLCYTDLTHKASSDEVSRDSNPKEVHS